MGYTTDFYGSFTLDKPLTIDQKNFLEMFAETRRMARDEKKIPLIKNPNRESLELLKRLNLPLKFYCGNGDFGQDQDESILDYNYKSEFPGLWCQWRPSEDGREIVWDGGEKFYNYVEWIDYLIENFLEPWGIKVNGEVEWQGEERDDRGLIVVKDNVVTTKRAKVTWE